MDTSAALITCVAGLAMGWINNIAGGAGIFALWAFLYACGLPLPLANPSARLAALAIGLCSFLGYARAGRTVPLRAWLQGLLAVPGALLGSRLALALPDVAFHGYLAVAVTLLLRQQLRWHLPADPRARPAWLSALGCLLIGLHMGYAQVGTGLVATLVLAAAYDRDLVAVNAAKSTIVILTSVASVGSFWASDSIAWPPAMVLAAGAAVGSYGASRWSIARGSHAVRRVVVAIAFLTLAEQLLRIALWCVH